MDQDIRSRSMDGETNLATIALQAMLRFRNGVVPVDFSQPLICVVNMPIILKNSMGKTQYGIVFFTPALEQIKPAMIQRAAWVLSSIAPVEQLGDTRLPYPTGYKVYFACQDGIALRAVLSDLPVHKATERVPLDWTRVDDNYYDIETDCAQRCVVANSIRLDVVAK